MKLVPVLLCCVLLNTVKAQLPSVAFSFSTLKDTALPCGQNCITLTATVPDIRAFANDYRVYKTNYFQPAVSPAAPGTSGNIVNDDIYSQLIVLPFVFPFFEEYYDALTINANGAVSFDATTAGGYAHWAITPIDSSLPSLNYDKAMIMGAFHDVDIQNGTTSPTRQIKYDITGTAGNRRFTTSFNKIPCYSQVCSNKINNTYQVTLYEGLGIVDVNLFEREICSSWNSGAAMIGMQNYERNKGIMAPGRLPFTEPRWGGLSMNETWRFVPNAGASVLKRVELYKSSGEFLSLGNTNPDGNGNFTVTFNNACVSAGTYIVKSVYDRLDNPGQDIFGADTITVTGAGSNTGINYSQKAYCITQGGTAIPTINGAPGGRFSADLPGLSIDSISGNINIAASTAGNYIVTYRINSSDPCVSTAATTDVAIANDSVFVWMGAVDNTWENPANWSCNMLPTPSASVTIYSGTVVINSNVTIDRLVVKPGATLNVNSGFNLTVLH